MPAPAAARTRRPRNRLSRRRPRPRPCRSRTGWGRTPASRGPLAMTATGARETAKLVAIRFDQGALHAIDQAALPWTERELVLTSATEVATAIRRLQIRGAPLIGVAAAYGIALELARDPSRENLEWACAALRDARPTAVNLAHAVDRVRDAVLRSAPDDAHSAALAQARAIHAEEEAASNAIAAHGAELLAGSRRVLTHCNTGALAAPGRGTALAGVAGVWPGGGRRRRVAADARPPP